MLTNILILLAGLALVVFGADYLVDGASGIARKAGLSEFLIGLTIVGIGTSTPEMVVSFFGAFQGKSDVAIGNVIGSNIFNILFILGLTAIILPVGITKENLRRDIPLNLLVSLLLVGIGTRTALGLGTENTLTRAGGLLFVLLFVLYMVLSFRSGKAQQDEEEPGAAAPARKTVWYVLMVLGGLAGLVIGGRLFVNAATDIARMAGWSDKFIAITILAGGTSLPELVTCIVAAAKQKDALALGNILGSNISNVLLILGGSALIHPLSFTNITPVDYIAFLSGGVLLLLLALVHPRRLLGRGGGALLVACEAAYMTFLICQL